MWLKLDAATRVFFCHSVRRGYVKPEPVAVLAWNTEASRIRFRLAARKYLLDAEISKVRADQAARGYHIGGID